MVPTDGTHAQGPCALTPVQSVAHHEYMKVASTHTYAAPPDAVFAVMTSPEVMVAKYAALGHLDVKIVEHSVLAGIVSVRSRRGVRLDVPVFAKRFFEPVNLVDQHDEWDPPQADGSRTGIWQVVARGVPVTTGGQVRLGPVAGGTIVEFDGEVTCPMPIVGGRIATFIAADVECTLREEEAFLDGYLRDHATAQPAPNPRRRAS